MGYCNRLQLGLLLHDDHRTWGVLTTGQHSITVRSQPRLLATPRIHDQQVHLSQRAAE